MERGAQDWRDGRVSPIRRLRRLRPRVRPRYKGSSFNRLIPNILTLIGLCAGLTALRFAMDAHFGPAAVAIVVAGGIDGLRGRIARLLKATSRFGAEFDSLTDSCASGCPGLRHLSVVVAMAGRYRVRSVPAVRSLHGVRLARFNAALEGAPAPAYAYNFFTGVPAPAGAGVALFPLFLGLEGHARAWAGW